MARYVGVGFLITATDYLVFLGAVAAGVGAAPANAASRVVATMVGAVLHRHYTFSGPQRLGLWRQMMAYAALSAVNLVISTVLILALTDQMGLSPIVAKVLTDVVVIAVSIVVGRALIFAPPR